MTEVRGGMTAAVEGSHDFAEDQVARASKHGTKPEGEYAPHAFPGLLPLLHPRFAV